MKTVKQILIPLSLLIASFTASAQCKTSSLPVNTGYTTSGPIANGTNDTHWEVATLSASIMANVIPTPPTTPYAAVITNSGGWGANDPNSNWISFYHPAGAWYQTTATGTYSMVLKREFTLCEDDDIQVDLEVARDNYISSLRIDGNPSIFSDVPGSVTSYLIAGLRYLLQFII